MTQVRRKKILEKCLEKPTGLIVGLKADFDAAVMLSERSTLLVDLFTHPPALGAIAKVLSRKVATSSLRSSASSSSYFLQTGFTSSRALSHDSPNNS